MTFAPSNVVRPQYGRLAYSQSEWCWIRDVGCLLVTRLHRVLLQIFRRLRIPSHFRLSLFHTLQIFCGDINFPSVVCPIPTSSLPLTQSITSGTMVVPDRERSRGASFRPMPIPSVFLTLIFRQPLPHTSLFWCLTSLKWRSRPSATPPPLSEGALALFLPATLRR